MKSKTEKLYDGLAERYDSLYADEDSRRENEALRRILGPLVIGRKILDIGSGTGLFLDLIPVTPDRYLGFDISAGMVAVARSKHPRHMHVHSSVEEYAVKERRPRFDFIVSLFSCVNYMADKTPMRVLCENDLEVGGRFFVMAYTPKRESWDHGMYSGSSERPAPGVTGDELRAVFRSDKLTVDVYGFGPGGRMDERSAHYVVADGVRRVC